MRFRSVLLGFVSGFYRGFYPGLQGSVGFDWFL